MNAINVLPKRLMSQSKTGCCPPFEPEAWDEQTFKFDEKLFVKMHTRSLMHIPLNMGSVMKKAMAQIEAAGAGDPDEYLMLSDDVSPWRANHYIALTKEVPGADMTRLSGTYLTKVFEGPYREMPRWHQQLLDYVQAQGKTSQHTYFYYALCPKCAKAYGKNYVVGFVQTA